MENGGWRIEDADSEIDNCSTASGVRVDGSCAGERVPDRTGLYPAGNRTGRTPGGHAAHARGAQFRYRPEAREREGDTCFRATSPGCRFDFFQRAGDPDPGRLAQRKETPVQRLRGGSDRTSGPAPGVGYGGQHHVHIRSEPGPGTLFYRLGRPPRAEPEADLDTGAGDRQQALDPVLRPAERQDDDRDDRHVR